MYNIIYYIIVRKLASTANTIMVYLWNKLNCTCLTVCGQLNGGLGLIRLSSVSGNSFNKGCLLCYDISHWFSGLHYTGGYPLPNCFSRSVFELHVNKLIFHSSDVSVSKTWSKPRCNSGRWGIF